MTACVFGAGAMLLAGPAAADGPRRNLHAPAQPVPDALLNLGLQYRVSLGGDLGACRGTAPALRGLMALETALSRTLEGSGCGFHISASGAVSIHRTPADAPPPSPAQPAAPRRPAQDPADPVILGEVVVTAERRPGAPQTSPSAITAVDEAQLAAAGTADTNGLAGLVAGMTVTNLGSGRNKVLLRGMSDGAFTGLTQSTVGLYLDQIPVTYSAPDPDLRLVDMDRVEVLRGPQGVLYGTGPIGGVVRLLTRRPDDLTPALQLSASRTVTRGVPSTDYTAIGNLPLGHGAGALRIVLYDETFGGYIDDVSLNLRRVNTGARSGGRLSASWRMAPDWVLSGGLVRQTIDTDDTHYVYRRLGGLRRANLVREPHSNDFDLLWTSLVGHGDRGRFEASWARIDHSFASRYDASEALPSFGSRARVGALDDAKDIDLQIGEATWTSPAGGDVRWTLGAFLSRGKTRSDTDLTAMRPVRAAVYGERRTDALSEVAVFGEAAYRLGPDLTLTVGGRLSHFDLRTESVVRQRGRERAFDGRRTVWSVSPKLTLDYRLDAHTNLYAQITEGRRTGGFNTAGPIDLDFAGGVGRPTRDYRGDRLLNFEAGAKALWLDDRLQTRVAVFLADWDDIQSDQFLPSGLAYAVNVGDGANQGLEVEAAWRPTEAWTFRGNALLARPRITRPSEAFNSRGDAGLPGVPAASANLTATWARRYGGLDAFASAHLSYVGPSRLTFDAERRYRMGDYVTGRLDVGLTRDGWTLSAFLDNPFDTVANTFSFGDPFRLPQALATTPLRPRTIGARLAWSL